MKKILLSGAAICATLAGAYAQPVLTAAKNNPVAGDVFYGHITGIAGVTVSAGSTGATWNYSTLSDMSYDTTTYMACSATPRCDSFPGSNLALYNNTSYSYGNAGSSAMVALGSYTPGSPCVFLSGTYDIMVYPFAYNSTNRDTYSIVYTASGTTVYITNTDSMIADGYGTLMLPHGTYTNVLRVHHISVSKDSVNFSGLAIVNVSQTEEYDWFDTAGFHSPLLVIGLDTSGGFTTPQVTNAEYYTLTPPGSAATGITNTNNGLQVFPNPVSNTLHLQFSLNNTIDAQLILADLTGRTVATVGAGQMQAGANTIELPVSNLPSGMYFARLIAPGKNLSQKVVISR